MSRFSSHSENPQPSANKIYEEACGLIPGGVSRNTVFRKPHPYYASRASGCYVTDIDGVERIDFANNMASLIHGHAHPAIVEGVTRQLQRGTAYTMATEQEVAFARHLCQRIKSIERVRFTNSGTEAVMAMIKAARAYTGRPKIAKAEGAYHGTYDFAEISQTSSPANWGDINQPNSVPLAKGTPQGVLDDVVVFPFNDTEKAVSILNRHANEIACVIIDPVPHRIGLFPASDDFLKAIFEWTRQNNALLAFDEVVTLRVNYGGAQQIFSVTPDLTAGGKIIGGGFPVGAFGGNAEVMKVLDPREATLPFPHSGTFSANPITMTAGLIAMELFDQEAVKKINVMAQKATEQIQEAIRIAQVPVSIAGAGSMFRIHLREKAPTGYREAYQPKESTAILKKLLDHLYQNGKMMLINSCTCMLSTVHTQKEIDLLTEAMLSAFRALKRDLENLPQA